MAPRDGAHDRLGRRCGGQAHSEPVQHHLDRDNAVADGPGCHGSDPAVKAGHGHEPGRHHQLGARPHGELRSRDRSDSDRQRDGQQVHAGGQRSVTADELEVLRHQEDEAEQREERNRDGAASRTEPHVTEEPDVQHRVRRALLPADKGGEKNSR